MKIDKNKVLNVLKKIWKRVLGPMSAFVLAGILVDWVSGYPFDWARIFGLAISYTVGINYGMTMAKDDDKTF